MSTWNIYHKDGSKLTDINGEQITVHGLEYSDSWMGECFLTINFKHEAPIDFQIGDYIIYRNERFELNYEPGKDKQARPNTYGEGFIYDSVKFNALQDELSRAEFLDVVLNDNELHYTALPKFPFYVQTLDDLLDRIQANLDEQIGAGLWKIYSRNKERSVQRGCLASDWLSMYGEGTSDNVIESKSITIDSKTCWEALALVNEEWDVNFIVRGRNIYVGTAGVQANHIFKYGLGKGLYEIVQNADSEQSIATRLRAYGSEKNLPSHYYADLGVKYVANITKVINASTNVELELDIDYIETYFKNERKYIVPGESQEQSFGWVLQVTFDFQTIVTGYVTQVYNSNKCRFYSELKGTQTDSGDEESKDKLDAFIAQVKAGNTKMYITSGLNKKIVPSSMKEYAENLPNNMSINRLMLPGFPHVSLSDFYDSLTDEEKKYVNPTGKQHRFSTDPHRPYIDSVNIEQIGLRSASQFFDTDDKTNGVIEIYPTIEEMVIGGVRVDEIDEGVAPDDDGRYDEENGPKNVDIYLNKAIDFDINDLRNDDFSISMKDGMCGGRTFKVASATKDNGRWRLTIERNLDDALDLWFPYRDYPIKKGDHFVLTGITLPDSYVNAASLKLLKYAIAYLDKNDYTRYVYQPKVDELFMARQHDQAQEDSTGTIKSLHDTLKAGDLMEFEDTDLRIGGVISIDQLIIKEEDGKIPTYDITLREDKEVGTIQKIQQQISSLASGNGGSGAGMTSSQVKGQIATEGSKHFISKLNDDVAKGTITFEKVQKFLQGLAIGESGKHYIDKGGGASLSDVVVDRLHDKNSTPSDRVIIGAQGFDLYMGDDGKSHLYVDYLTTRTKMFASSVEIRKVSYSGGTTIFSNAGSQIAKVSYILDSKGKKVIAYKCYSVADDGTTKTMNWWHVGMMALCQTFNVKAGEAEKLENRYYWRMVVGVGQEKLDGKLYDYVILSNIKEFQGNLQTIPSYSSQILANEQKQKLVFGNVMVEVSVNDGMKTLASLFLEQEGKDVDDNGNKIADRIFYGYDGEKPDEPAPFDVIVQVGDQIQWKKYGNAIKLSTSTEDSATDNAPAITMYHKLGAPHYTGKLDANGNKIVNPFQWKIITTIISPEKVMHNTENFQLFQGTPDNIVDPITIMYDIVPSVDYITRHPSTQTTTPADIVFTLRKRTGNKLENLDDAQIYAEYTLLDGSSNTKLLPNKALSDIGNLYQITSVKLKSTIKEADHEDIVVTLDLPVLTDGNAGEKGEKGDKGDKGEQGQQGLRGLQGEKGEQGIPGTNGKDGKTTYFHIKYSPVNPPTAASMTETPNTYIGTYVDFQPDDSSDPDDYQWHRFEGLQGKDGTNGIPGKNGINGLTSYLHIKYSNDGGKTLTANIGEEPGSWIGQYTDYEQQDSTDPTKYTWSKIKGEKGDPGVDGVSPVTYTVDFLLQEKKVYIYVRKVQGGTDITQLIGNWNDTLTCNVYIDGEYHAYKDSDVMSDSYIDLLAFPAAKTIDIILKQKDGDQQLAIGNYTIGSEFEYQIIPEVVIFDTNDEGKLTTTQQSATIKCYRNGRYVTNKCFFSFTNCNHLNCTPGLTTNMVTIKDITTVTVDQIEMPAQNGYAQVQIIDEYGRIHYAYVKFQVNITRFVAKVTSNNKTWASNYTEISGKVDGISDKVDGMSGKLDGLPTGDQLEEWKSSIIQTARNISLEVTKKRVGRRNLLYSTAFRKDGLINFSPRFQPTMTEGVDGMNAVKFSVTRSDSFQYYGLFWSGKYGNIKVKKNTDYTFSCWVKSDNPYATIYTERYAMSDATTTVKKKPIPVSNGGAYSWMNDGNWQLVTNTFNSGDTEYVEINIFLYNGDDEGKPTINANAWFCMPMLEEGSEYTGWTESEQDCDYVGGNMLDDTRTLVASTQQSNLLTAPDVTADAYEGAYAVAHGKADESNNNECDFLRWNGEGERVLNLEKGKNYVFSFLAMAKGNGVLKAYMYKDSVHATIYSENSQGDVTQNSVNGISNFTLTSQWKRYWVHWRIDPYTGKGDEVLPQSILLRAVKDCEVWVCKPKLEEGASMTEYTERKTDLVDKASLKKAGIEITSEQVTLYGDKVQVKTPKANPSEGYDEAAMFENGKLNANFINAGEVVANGINAKEIVAKKINITEKSTFGIWKIEHDNNLGYDIITATDLAMGNVHIKGSMIQYTPAFVRSGSILSGYMRTGAYVTEFGQGSYGNYTGIWLGKSADTVASGTPNDWNLPTEYKISGYTVNTSNLTAYVYSPLGGATPSVYLYKPKGGVVMETNAAIRGVFVNHVHETSSNSGGGDSAGLIVAKNNGNNSIYVRLPENPIAGQQVTVIQKGTGKVYITSNQINIRTAGSASATNQRMSNYQGQISLFIYDGADWNCTCILGQMGER